MKKLVFAIAVGALAGCGGSQSTVPHLSATPGAPPAAAAGSSKAAATLKITVPAKATAAAARRAQYVSPATQSIAIAFTPSSSGTTQTFNQNLTAGSPGCTTGVISPLVCTLQFNLPPGAYTASFTTYDGVLDGNGNPQGNVLSQNQNAAITIVAGQPNAINVTLGGVATALDVAPAPNGTIARQGPATLGIPFPSSAQGVSVIGVDADANYIVGPGAPVPALSSSDPAIAIATPAPAAPNLFMVTLSSPANLSYSLTATLTPAQNGGAPLSSQIALNITHPVTQYSQSGSRPIDIVSGPDGALWFTDQNNIGRITTAGSISEFSIGSAYGAATAIASGPDGALWFGESGYIGRITTGGSITQYASGFNQAVSQIVSGSDGALWYTIPQAALGRITTAGTASSQGTQCFVIGGAPSGPLASGPDGNIWVPCYHQAVYQYSYNCGPFNESSCFYYQAYNYMYLGAETTASAVAVGVSYAQSTNTNYAALGITTGPDGSMWLPTLSNGLFRVTTSGVVTQFSLPHSAQVGGYGHAIVTGADGALWIAAGTEIERVTTSGAVTEYVLPGLANAFSVARGPDDAIWYVDNTNGVIGRL